MADLTVNKEAETEENPRLSFGDYVYHKDEYGEYVYILAAQESGLILINIDSGARYGEGFDSEPTLNEVENHFVRDDPDLEYIPCEAASIEFTY